MATDSETYRRFTELADRVIADSNYPLSTIDICFESDQSMSMARPTARILIKAVQELNPEEVVALASVANDIIQLHDTLKAMSVDLERYDGKSIVYRIAAAALAIIIASRVQDPPRMSDAG